jgi:hypothetical protein
MTGSPSNFTIKGSYGGNSIRFTGLATDEIYLIRAECHARKGDAISAMKDLNALLEKRWKSTDWVPFTAGNANDALNKILIERRKELCFRGIRWNDLRRLNMDPQFSMTLQRTINSQTYTLPSNDPKYVLPIPIGVILLNNIEQNPR